MRLLVLGGTNFVGRSVVGEALRRGDEVTTVNRGVSGEPPEGARRIQADRRDSRALEAALGADEWDAVIDTWSMEPVVVRESARLLAGRAGHYGYVSSRSVYCWPLRETCSVQALPSAARGTGRGRAGCRRRSREHRPRRLRGREAGR